MSLQRGDVIHVKKEAIGNPRATRVRVEEVVEYRPDTRRTLIYGVEVTKDGVIRHYFGRRYSEWRAWLAEDDYELIGEVSTP